MKIFVQRTADISPGKPMFKRNRVVEVIDNENDEKETLKRYDEMKCFEL